MMKKTIIAAAKRSRKTSDPVISPESPTVPERPSTTSPPKKPTIPYLPPEKPAT